MVYHRAVRSGVIAALLGASSLWALAATNGTPLGGFGTGYVIYNARTGNFATASKIMPAASLASSEFNSYQSSSCGFHFYANGTSKQKATTTTEDAKCPIYTADFGTTGGVGFKLTAFGPFISGSSSLYDQLAHSPLACFDIAATNPSTTAAASVSVALEFSNQSSGGTNLLGGANVGASDGTSAITWAGDTTKGNAYMIVNCDNASATYSSGAMGTFLTNGTLTAGAGNLASANCTIPAGGTAHFRFIMAWWQRWINPGGTKSPGGAEDHWYHNFYANSKAAAVFGMSHFDQIENGATSIVNRTMASNFPDWYKDRLLNNLYPMIHNSVAAKDGRVGFWEGAYPIIGTIDQGEHAALWYVFNWPQNQWRELQYWARESHKASEGALFGQIHHDFNGCATGGWSYSATDSTHFLDAWDNSTHADYWYQPNTTTWSDLNSMFIFKAYELMLATGDRDSLTKYWPYIKNTCNRLLVQCGTGHLPADNTKSTYDDGSATPVYASGVALATYQAVIAMAQWLGDDSTATRLTNWYNLGRAEFAPRFFNSSFATGMAKSEGDVAGYSWARYFCFPAIFDSNVITTGCNRLWTYYKAQSSERARLGQWHFYTYDHWGGADIAIGKQDTTMLISQWDWDYEYNQVPACVFWQDLNSSNTGFFSYMTAPCVWRGMMQMTGYLLDNANNRLWIRPMIPTSMGKIITNAPLVNPRGWGTLNYDENPVSSSGRCQNLTVTFDSLTTIKQIVLKNNTGTATPGAIVTNNGAGIGGFTLAAEGSGYEKNIRITLASPILVGPQGLGIQVFNAPVGVVAGTTTAHPPVMLSCSNGRIYPGSTIRYTVDITGPVVMDLIGVNGVVIANIMRGTSFVGPHSFVWNGRSTKGAPVSPGVVVLRLSSSKGAVSSVVIIGK